MKATRIWLCIGAIGLTGALIGGCGGDDSDSTVTETSTQEAATGTTDAGTATDTGESMACVDAWNRGSNASGQEALLGLYPDGASGKIVIGVEDGTCVLSSYTDGDAEYAVLAQSENAFAETGGGPAEEFSQYEASIAPVDVVLQASGEVEPAS